MSRATFDFLVLAFALSCAAYSFATYYHKTVLGRVVRALLEKGAVGKENAVSFSSLNVKGNFARALSRGALSTLVQSVEEIPATVRHHGAKEEIGFPSNFSFFIPEKSEEKARKLYGDTKGAGTILLPIVFTVAASIVSLLAYLILPALIRFSA